MSLVSELGRELFLRDVLEPVLGDYHAVVIDTPPNLGLLTVNALVVAETVIAPVSGEDAASLHGIRELRQTLRRLSERLGPPAPELLAVLTRWQSSRISSRAIEHALVCEGLTPSRRDASSRSTIRSPAPIRAAWHTLASSRTLTVACERSRSIRSTPTPSSLASVSPRSR